MRLKKTIQLHNPPMKPNRNLRIIPSMFAAVTVILLATPASQAVPDADSALPKSSAATSEQTLSPYFVVLNQDIMRVPADILQDTHVLSTWVGGRAVYERK